MTPSEGFSNTFGETELISFLRPGARAASLYITTTVNLAFDPQNWIQPDVTVLHGLPRNNHEDVWVPAELCTMVVEFVSRSSRSRDRIDKPAICAAGGIPYFMRVEIARPMRHVEIELRKLVDGRYEQIAIALTGQVFKAVEPFPIEFAPEDLLY
jgi:hypothetical protein